MRNQYRVAISFALIVSLLATSTPVAAQTIANLVQETSFSFALWYRAGGVAKLLQGNGEGIAKKQEKQAERNARVVRIEISPGDVTVPRYQRVQFAAIAYGADDSPISGVKIKWSAEDDKRKKGGPISPQGEFRAVAPGTFKITAQGAGQTAQVTVVVEDGPRLPTPGDKPDRVKPVTNRIPPGTVAVEAKKIPKRQTKRTFAHGRRATATALPFLAPVDWGNENYGSSSDPGNSLGDPPGSPVDGGAGSGNFQFSAPIVELAGRGINVSLEAAYNGRLWNKASNSITYDIDRGWPAPGFSIGFGKMIALGINNGAMLVDADGTRHSFEGNIQFFNWGTIFTGHTTDGSFIDYTYTTGTNGILSSAQAKLPDGTLINYTVYGPQAYYPTSITDANGNYVIITYVNNSGPRIQTITDTLNRAISFYYDSNSLLTAITAPGYDSGSARTLVRFHYHQLALNHSFSLPAGVRDSNPWVVDAIYYPGTGTGYWFNDSDSYSTFGMIRKVSERRGMVFSGPDPVPPAQGATGQGTITSAGQVTKEDVYNYPQYVGDTSGTQSTNLPDAPTYTSLISSWTRDGVNVDSATTTYSVPANANPRSVTITLPNGTRSVQLSYNHPGVYDDGLVYRDEVYDANNVLLQSSSSTWQQGAYSSPRPTRVEKTDERQQVIASEFNYGTVYNQVTEARDYDYGGTTLLRRTTTTYQNSANYTNRHIFNLPLTVEIYDSNNTTRLQKLVYEYDGQALTARPDVVQHDDAYNPYAADEGLCYWETDWSDPDCQGSCSPELMGCDGYCPQNYYCPYNATTDYRGNLTQSTSYTDGSALTGPIAETYRYDIAGNMVTRSTACCEQTSFVFTVDTQYAFPQAKIRGSATDPYQQVKISASYDFNTGANYLTVDANGRPSSTGFNPASLRPITTTKATGAHTDIAYDDVAMTVTSTTYLAASEGGGIAGQNVKTLNGLGEIRREAALGANSTWDFVDLVFNNMGQVAQRSRPYRTGETPQWTTATYDALGRNTRTTAADGSTTETYYNEKDFDTSDSYTPARPNVASTAAGETTLVRDAWGRERWGRTDSRGQLVEVVEPNPAGNGSTATGGWVTTYSYNTLGNLITIHQDAQTRSFSYDSLGRITAQKLAEASATLNSAGTYVGSGTWSEVFTYDVRSNLTSRTDARGVKTTFNYNNDPLNRVQSVSWDTTADPNHGLQPTDPNYYQRALDAATVTFQYVQKGSPTDLKDITQPASITAGGVSTENFDYDGEGRLHIKTLTLNSRTSYPFATNYDYDSLDRLTDVTFPAQYGNGNARRIAHHNYDIASRLSSLTYNTQSVASNIGYNADSQQTTLNVGSGPNQITETYSYSAQTGLLDSQTVARGATTLLNLSYDYADANNKRTGQLKKILNNLNHNKDRAYSYDALGRLTQATGGASGALWTQTYSYDRYGNRTSVSATGNLAKVADPKVVLPTDQLAAKTNIELPEALRQDLPRSISDTPFSLGPRPANLSSTVPQSPPVFTDDPLPAGIQIKAVHITELRTAVNQARALAGLAAATWTDNSLSGVAVKVVHITELRSALAAARAALGFSVATYTDPTLTAGSTLVKAVHIQELRQRVTETLSGPAGCPPGQTVPIDQFVKNFYQGALNRQPNATELQSWTDQLRQSYYQGQSQLLATAQYFGRQLFKSQEYLNRNRAPHDYVYDLYKGYLQREPDQSGWDFWTSQVAANGVDAVREGFSLSSEFATKVASLCSLSSSGPSPISTDGLTSLAYDAASNRITTAGFQYDAAGNQLRSVRAGGAAEKFQYDAANRLVKVTDDYGYALGTYTYGGSTERLIADEGGLRTYYSCDATVEYSESGGSTAPVWSRTYVLLGSRLLATVTPNGSNGENLQYHHPDRLGTRLVTNAQDTTFFEQQTLPYGTALNESAPAGGATGGTNKRFTSYDRSSLTGLDYAVNRHYDSQQGRFTQVDPIGMRSVSLESPQTLNLYAYCMNDPINHTDPSGLGFFSFLKKIFKAILKILSNKWVQIALMVAMVAVLHFYYHYNFGFGVASNAPSGAAPVLHAAASTTSTVAAASSGGAALSAGMTGTFLAGVAADEGIVVLTGSLLTDLGTLALGTAAAAGQANKAVQKKNTKSSKKKPEQKKQQNTPCSSKFSDFFANLDLYKDVANQLNTKLEFILAHSSWESGWNGPHAKALHNLFGLTNAGGPNQTFNTYKEGADQYVQILKPHVSGAQTMDSFLEGAKKAGYNSATPGYYDKVKNQVDSVRKHAQDCGVAL
jgi:RHS repeat-associated protein